MRALRYALEEAFTSLWRGRQAGLLSTLTIALALFVLGGFLDVTANLELLGAEWSNAAELSVYLKDDITPAERHAVEGVVAPRTNTFPSPRRSRASVRRSAISPRRSTASAGTRCRRRSRSVCDRGPVSTAASTPSRRGCARWPASPMCATTGNG